MECGIANKCGRKLDVTVNGRKFSVDCEDGFYVEISEESSVRITVAPADDEYRFFEKIPNILYRFFLSPYVLFRYSEMLEIKENIGFSCDFEIKAAETIILADSDDSFAVCTVLADGKKYVGNMNYTHSELRKQFAEYILFSVITVLGSAAYMFLLAFFIKENRKYYLIFLSAASVLPIAWIIYNSFNSIKLLKKKSESEDTEI